MNTKPKLKQSNLMMDKLIMTENNKSNLANRLGYWPLPSQVKAIESSNAPEIRVVEDGLGFRNPKTNKSVLLAGNIGGEQKTFNIRDPQSGFARFKMKDAAKIDETLGVTPEQIEEENKPEVKPNNDKEKLEKLEKELGINEVPDDEIKERILQANPLLSPKQLAGLYDNIVSDAYEEERDVDLDDIYYYLKREGMLEDGESFLRTRKK
jgi:hypothetical protein